MIYVVWMCELNAAVVDCSIATAAERFGYACVARPFLPLRKVKCRLGKTMTRCSTRYVANLYTLSQPCDKVWQACLFCMGCTYSILYINSTVCSYLYSTIVEISLCSVCWVV